MAAAAIGDSSKIQSARSASDGASIPWLVAPIEPEDFFKHYWEKQPLVIEREAPAYYESLLTLQDVDRILACSSIRPPEITLVKNGKNIPLGVLHTNDLITQPVMHDALFEQYRDGATLILQFLHERWQPLATLSANVANQLSAAMQANVYVTPKNAQGFARHYDDHDVFVLQVAGQKRWQIDNEPTVYLPKHEPPQKAALSKSGSCRTFVLRQGDCAYIPRGWAHEAASTDVSSIHVTLGVNSLTWADVLRRAVETACTGKLLRESLPPGFATDQARLAEAEQKMTVHVRRFVASLNPAHLVNEAAIIARRGGETPSLGRLRDLDLAAIISDSTKIRRRLEVYHRVEHEEERSRLYFHGRLMTFPAHVAPDLDFISSAVEFTPAELPGDLDHNGRMVFLSRLVEEGFLRVIEH
jgi:ribosomal protein L16 Arg81 hydroxylase